MMYSRYAVGKDGLTPYERRRGRPCRIPSVCFGEKVWYKQLREGKDRKDKFCTEWHEGIWLGHTRNSNEHIIGLSDGAVKAFSIRRQDLHVRWNAGLVQGWKPLGVWVQASS